MPTPDSPKVPNLTERRAGVLLHVTSLPGPDGSGDLGDASHSFIDALADAGAAWWQMLPVVVPGPGLSPYSSPSASAGNPYLISLETLRRRGLVSAGSDSSLAATSRIDAGAMIEHRHRALREAYQNRKREDAWTSRALDEILSEETHVRDYALFAAIHAHLGGRPWTEWPKDLRDRDRTAMRAAESELAEDVGFHLFAQSMFREQWNALRAHAARAGVALLGDAPIFVDADSADVWANRAWFDLREDGHPRVVAGVPPDAFSATGQRWGNALYRWDVLREHGYGWWIERLRAALARFDAVRIDHFIGFYRYWEIPAEEPTALVGTFQPGPREAFFEAVERELGLGRLIAEDLGIVTDEVNALRERFRIPGMRVLQFSMWPDPSAEHLRPWNYPEDSVAYTGTHDNDTTAGWLASLEQTDAGRQELDYIRSVLPPSTEAFVDRLTRLVFESKSRLAVVPMQDLLGLGTEARMNHPGTTEGNWLWRMGEGDFSDAVRARLRALIREAHRAPK